MSTRYSMEIHFTDVSGQRSYRRVVDGDDKFDTTIDTLIAESNFIRIDSQGRPLTYHARLEREGLQLTAAEIARDALQHGARLVLTPTIDAGA